jgi:FAD/FMN-containing dehydrogenase
LRRITKEAEIEELSKDAGIIVIRPADAFVAESDGDVMAVFEDARRRGLAVTPRGGGTSIPSQAVGPGIILLQRRGETVVEAGSVRCGPSRVKDDLNRELDPLGRWIPPDPSSYESCTVGGMVANNSSGTRTFKYGSTVDYVKELRVVLPEEGVKTVRAMSLEEAQHADSTTRKVASLVVENQKIIREERPRVTKNSCGYRLEKVVHDGVFDLPKLFVGSEGTLGVVTDITFATPLKPKSRALLIVETSLDGLDKVADIFRRLKPSAVELVDKSVFRQTGREERLKALSRTDEEYLVFCELDGIGHDDAGRALEAASGSEIAGYDPLAVSDPGELAAATGVRNEILTLAQEIRVGTRALLPGVEDLVVPPERLGDLVALLKGEFEGRGLPYISYGHAGDANLHMRPLLDPDSAGERRVLEEIMEECFERVWKMGGSITGEHGDGMLRAKYVARQYPKTHALMKLIREAYDPKGLLSPGVKILR